VQGQVLLEVAEKGFEQEQLVAIMHQVLALPVTVGLFFCVESVKQLQVELDGLAVSADRGLRLALDVTTIVRFALYCSSR
jgi:hypothetical protein